MKVYPIILFIFYQSNLMAQPYQLETSPLKFWHSYQIPKDSSIIWNYGNDTTSWGLFLQDGDIYTSNVYYPDARAHFPGEVIPDAVMRHLGKEEKGMCNQSKGYISVDDGYLVGINNGEWGGYIVWYSMDGLKRRKVSNDKVYEFIKKDGIIYGIEGTNHTYTSKGNLIRLTKKGEKWVSERILELPYAPFGICINDKNNFVIGTLRNIIEVDSNGICKVLYDDPVWIQYEIYLYPWSLVMKDDAIYVGMRKGVFKYDLNTGKQEWLMKD